MYFVFPFIITIPHFLFPSPQSLGNVLCVEHRQAPDFFCRQCELLVCPQCIVTTHRGHSLSMPLDVLREEHQTLQTHYYTLEEVVMKMNVGITDVDDMIAKLKDKGEKVTLEIHKHFDELRSVLNDREQLLVTTTDEIVQKKVATLKGQADKLSALHRDLEAKRDRVLRILHRSDDISYLGDKDRIITDVLRSLEKSKHANVIPVVTAADGPEYLLCDSLMRNARQFGQVFCSPEPQKFTARGEGLKKAFLKKEVGFVVEARDCYGHRSYVSGTEIAVTIQPSNTPFTIKEHEKGEYTVRYTPLQLGRHSIEVTADSKFIAHGDFTAVVFGQRDYFSLVGAQPITTITKHQINTSEASVARGQRGSAPTEVSTMRGVCVLPRGEVLFTDQLCLRVISTSGQLLRTIGSFGDGNGQFKLPMGVAVNSQGVIFVSDGVNHRIQKFLSDGKFLAKFGDQGTRNGYFQSPAGLAVLGDDKLFVVDSGNHRVQVFQQRNNRYISTIGRRGKSAGQFSLPHDIAVDSPRQRILVSDTDNHRIQALSLDGKPLMQFGNQCSSPLPPSYKYLTVDCDGFVLSTDINQCCVVVFTPQGFPLGRLGTGPGKFRTPHGICLNSEGQVIISDSSLHCLQVF